MKNIHLLLASIAFVFYTVSPISQLEEVLEMEHEEEKHHKYYFLSLKSAVALL